MTFTYYRWRSRPGTWLGERIPEALICVWIAWPVQAGICWAPVNLNSIHLQRLSLAVCILVVVVERHHHFWKLGRCSFYCQCHYVKSVWYLIYGEFEQHIPYQVEHSSLHSFVLLSSAATKGERFVSRKQYIASFGNIAILQYSENIVIF